MARRGISARFNIADTAIFYGNLALAGAFDYGWAAGTANYQNIRWQGWNPAGNNNSIPGSHLLNNFDINNSTQTPNSLVVTFVGNGGTINGVNQHSFTVPSGTVLNASHVPADTVMYKTDYDFTGWSEDAVGLTSINPVGITVTQNRTFFAQWGHLTVEFNFRAQNWRQTNEFVDVQWSQWYNNATSTLTNIGLINGFPDGTFRPSNSITRAEFATIAARFTDMSGGTTNNFTDVSGHWAEVYINVTRIVL